MSLRRAVAGLLAPLVALASCGSDGTPVRAEQAPQERPVPAPLPFGLEQVDGTEAIGRPMVFDHVTLIWNGQPIRSRALRAAYRVTGDPTDVLQAWAGQLVPLELGDVLLHSSALELEHVPWAEIGTHAEADPDAPGPGWAGVELWDTHHEPILIVSIDRHHGSDGVASEPLAGQGRIVPPTRSPQVSVQPPGPGEELFSEQGEVVRVPEGARALMPMIPTTAGTGGSTSLLASGDELGVIQAMLDEAGSQDGHGEVVGPELQDQDGARVVIASYGVPAGGWGFHVVAVRDPGDAEAMLWVTSYAD